MCVNKMIYLKWALYAPVSIFVAILFRLLAPIVALFCNEDGWLPDWLSWFATPDNSCDGDEGHKERWPKDGLFWTYARRVAWLLRNVGYGFDIQVLGIEIKETDEITINGNPSIGEQSGISGTCYREAFRDGEKIAFQWYYVKHYKLLGKWNKCVRIGFGWKLWNEKPFIAQFWLYCNPVK